MIDTEELEDLEVLPATRSPHGYLASPLTDNIHMTDEGYLVVVGCPIARTGWQKYAVKDLPQQRAADLGVDISNPEASIELYRPASEVFNPEFLASLNGKPITDGHPPGGEFVDPENFNKYAKGHIQNVRKGTEPLEDGEWPIIADLVISAEPLIGKVRSKAARELSLGYDFGIERDGEKIIQCNMLGNHNAVVPSGRAGDLVRIEDAAPEDNTSLPIDVQPAPVAEVIEALPAYPPIAINFKPNKEKQPVAKPNKLLRLFMGKHIIEMARATDADPEKIMEAAEALHEPEEPNAEDARSKDGEVPAALKENEFKAEDSNRAHDALARALDRALDARAKDAKAKDANIEALKTLLDEFLSEEEGEAEHAANDDDPEVDPSELEAVLAGEADDEEPCAECGKAHDGEECPGESMEASGEEAMDEEGESPDPDSDDDQEDVEVASDKGKASDRARAADAATAVLRMIRPFAARSNDKAFQATFNRALDSVKKSSRTSTGSYGAFASSARARDKAGRSPNPTDRTRATDAGKADPISKMQEFYNTAHKGGK